MATKIQNAVADTAKKGSVIEFLESRKSDMAMALPKGGLTADRLLKITLSAFRQTPELMQCTQESLINAVMVCGQLGLEPNTPLGHAYLIPYFNGKTQKYECQFQLG
jgi:recombination protein RecT